MSLEKEPQLSKPKEEMKPSIELSQALEVLGELEFMTNQLEKNSLSFSTFTESLKNRIANLRRGINEGLASPIQEKNNFQKDFAEYVQEVKRLEELVVEINATVENLKGKSKQLGGSLGAEEPEF